MTPPPPVELVIEGRPRDIGGFSVRRLLPYAKRRMVGPFIFFDHFGPLRFPPGHGLDVRPHPHIGLATVTYLFDGAIVHRDNLPTRQAIRPGDVNWMIAGRGIAHSERTGDEERAAGSALHGIQSWVALPRDREESPPSFRHHPAASLPEIEIRGVRLRVIAGSAFGRTAPVEIFSPTLYVDARMPATAELDLPPEHEERAVYVAEGRITIAGEAQEAGRLVVLAAGTAVAVRAEEASRLMILGGAPLDGERHIWWNFVHSDPTRIERAKADWAEGRFPKIPGETEFIPLPKG